MRRTASLLAAIVVLSACSSFQKTIGLKDDAPAHVPPKTTSIYGNWILSEPDSTAFAGASQVELNLSRTDFVITADYPTQGRIIVRGTATLAPESGLLTLTPTETDSRLRARGAFVMARGEPYTLLATAAGNTLVFASPSSAVAVPSSVWHAKAAAREAGKLDSASAGTKP